MEDDAKGKSKTSDALSRTKVMLMTGSDEWGLLGWVPRELDGNHGNTQHPWHLGHTAQSSGSVLVPLALSTDEQTMAKEKQTVLHKWLQSPILI